jgi:hypothetical protein
MNAPLPPAQSSAAPPTPPATPPVAPLAQFSQSAVLEDLRRLRNDLHGEIQKYDVVDVDERLQSEYANLAVLIQRVERLVLQTKARQHQKRGELGNLISSLRVASDSLAQKQPNIALARHIRLDVEQEVVRYEQWFPVSRFMINRFLYVWHSPSTPLKVIYGLICSFVLIFGGLMFFAVVQSAIYAAGTARAEITDYKEAKTREVALNKAIFQQQQFTQKILVIEERNFSKPNGGNPIAAAELMELRKQLAQVNKKIQDLQLLQADQKPQRPPADLTPVQQVLANFADLGISRTLSQLLWVAAAGTLGSIVSILIRVIEEFHDKDYRDRLTPFFIGFFKPVIGASFGILFLAFVNSGVVSTPLFPVGSGPATPSLDTRSETRNDNQQSVFFLFAVAFVVGFSERLAKDTITRLDGTLPKADAAAPSLPAAAAPRVVIIRPKRYVAVYPTCAVNPQSGQNQPTSQQPAPNQSAPNQSAPNQSAPNQSNRAAD